MSQCVLDLMKCVVKAAAGRQKFLHGISKLYALCRYCEIRSVSASATTEGVYMRRAAPTEGLIVLPYRKYFVNDA